MRALVLLILAFASFAHARPVGLIQRGPVALTPVTIPFGVYTPANTGMGAVRLSNPGLGLQTGGPRTVQCANTVTALGWPMSCPGVSWTITDQSGSGYWQIYGTALNGGNGYTRTVAEGPNALTPNLSSSGVTNLSSILAHGDYAFTVTATYNGTTTSTTLTLRPLDHTITIGDTESITSLPASFQSYIQGGGTGTIALQVGAIRAARSIWNVTNCSFSPTVYPAAPTSASYPVKYTYATPISSTSSRGLISGVNIYGCSGIDIDGLTFTHPNPGPMGTSNVVWLLQSAGGVRETYTELTNATFAFKPGDGSLSGIVIGGTDYFAANNIQMNWVYSPFLTESNVTDTYVTITHMQARDFSNNGLLIGNTVNGLFQDIDLIGPTRVDAEHCDYVQIYNGTTPRNVVLNRITAIQAEGDELCQGLYYGHTVATGLTGYATGGVLYTTSACPASYGPQPSQPITWLGAATPAIIKDYPNGGSCAAGWNLTDPTVTFGSAGSPVTYWQVPPQIAINGLIYIGVAGNGLYFADAGGVTLNAVTVINVNPQQSSSNYFQGSTNGGSTLTINSWGSGIGLYAPYFIYTPAIPIPPSLSLPTTGNPIQSGTATMSAYSGGGYPPATSNIPMWSSGDLYLNSGPNLFVAASDSCVLQGGAVSSGVCVPVVGINTIANTLVWDKSNWITVGGAVSANWPASWGVNQPTFFNLARSDLTATQVFANNPKTALSAISRSQWRAMSNAQVLSTVAAALTPTATHPQALTTGGLWNDGSNQPVQ